MTIITHNPKAFSERPGLVIFDTDNTLYPYDPAHAAAIAATRAKAVQSLGITADQFDVAYHDARRQVKQQLEGTASSHSRLLYFQCMLELIGLRTQILMALDFEQTYWRVFLANAKIFEGVMELLDDLRIHGVPTAIVTDLTAQVQFRKIVYFGLDHYFDYVVTSEESGFDKPHPSPFNIVVQKVGDIQGPIWMIGDHPICDIKGARDALGASTMQKRHAGITIGAGDSEPDLIFDEFTELRTWISEIM